VGVAFFTTPSFHKRLGGKICTQGVCAFLRPKWAQNKPLRKLSQNRAFGRGFSAAAKWNEISERLF
jgi:hypothetical protein